MLDDIARISSEFDAALAAANTASALEELRVHYFGRKGGLIPALFSRLKEVSKDQKKAVGEALNNFRDYAQASYEEKIAALVAEALDGKTRDIIDVTLPARLRLAGPRAISVLMGFMVLRRRGLSRRKRRRAGFLRRRRGCAMSSRRTSPRTSSIVLARRRAPSRTRWLSRIRFAGPFSAWSEWAVRASMP